MKSRRFVNIFVLLLIVAIVAAASGFYRYLDSRIANYSRIETLIAQLAMTRPRDVTDPQWSGCIYWTWQLHTNYGGDNYFDHAASCTFADEFEQRLDGQVSLQAVDWIWDQYIQHTKGAQRYSDKYRPTTDEYLDSADKWDYPSLDEWKSRFRERRQ